MPGFEEEALERARQMTQHRRSAPRTEPKREEPRQPEKPSQPEKPEPPPARPFHWNSCIARRPLPSPLPAPAARAPPSPASTFRAAAPGPFVA